jgi:pseudouridine-5'-phosphate glycosidase/pseudouridine kinase
LIKHNATIGSQIAAALRPQPQLVSGRPIIVGGTVVDVTAKVASSVKDQVLYTSTPGVVFKSLGGVGRNVAEACHRAGGQPLFISAVGNDLDGNVVLTQLREQDMDIQGISTMDGQATAVYNAMLHQDGELIAAVADMRIHEEMKPTQFASIVQSMRPSIVCTDGNLSCEYLEHIARYCIQEHIPLLFEPTSVVKATKIYHMHPSLLKAIQFITPDAYEAKKLSEMYVSLGLESHLASEVDHVFPGLEQETESLLTLLNLFDNVIVKCGWRGVLVGTSRTTPTSPTPIALRVGKRYWNVTHIQPQVMKNVVSVTGAGDSLVGVVLAGLHNSLPIHHSDLVRIVTCGVRAAEYTIQSPLSVSPLITPDLWK